MVENVRTPVLCVLVMMNIGVVCWWWWTQFGGVVGGHVDDVFMDQRRGEGDF